MASGVASHSPSPTSHPATPGSREPVAEAHRVMVDMLNYSVSADTKVVGDSPQTSPPVNRDALLVLLPLLIILSSLLFLLLLFLVCVLLLRRRRGISLGDSDGPVDLSREELIGGEGGFEGVEERWLETVDEEIQRAYRRAKGETLHSVLYIFVINNFVLQTIRRNILRIHCQRT